nr:site-specific integrase [Paracoccus saliphilus]
MPKVRLPHLEHRPTGYYFRRRIPAPSAPGHAHDKKSSKVIQTGSICLSLRTQFLRDAKRLARRLTAASDALFAARAEQDMPIAAETMVAILKAVRDQEISAHERMRARAGERSWGAVEATLSQEALIQDALREEIALGRCETATPVLEAGARRIGLALDALDPDYSVLAHHATRLLVEISAERARREAGDYGAASVLAELVEVADASERRTSKSRAPAERAARLAGAFSANEPVERHPVEPSTALSAPRAEEQARTASVQPEVPLMQARMTAAEMPASTASVSCQRSAPSTAALEGDAPATAAPPPGAENRGSSEPIHPVLMLPQEPEARRRALDRALPDLRIDKAVLSDRSKEALLDPWNMTIEEAFDAYFEVKLAGYGDEFFRSQKRRPQGGENWMRNSRASLVVARRIWSDLLGNCRLRDVTDDGLNTALLMLARLPRDHGKAFKADTVQEIIDQVDMAEIAREAEAFRRIASQAGISQGDADKLIHGAKIPRLRAETYLKHGRAVGRIGRFLEGLGLLGRNPFTLCSWSKQEEADLKNSEAARARVVWDDRIYKLFRTPVFQGECDGPGDPLFWAPLIGLFCGARMEEVLQLAPDDIGTEDGIPYLQIRNVEGNRVKSDAGQRKLPIHPNLIKLGFLDLVEMRRREDSGRLFPDLARGETKGNHAELFSKAFGYYRKVNEVYWPGLDFHALRSTFSSFLLNNDDVKDSRARRLMGHAPASAMEASYAQGLRMSSLLRDIQEVTIDISMIRSPFTGVGAVVSLEGVRQRLATE